MVSSWLSKSQRHPRPWLEETRETHLISRPDGRGEASRHVLEAGVVALGSVEEDSPGGMSVAAKSVQDDTTEAERLADGGIDVERVVVAREAVDDRLLGADLLGEGKVGSASGRLVEALRGGSSSDGFVETLGAVLGVGVVAEGAAGSRKGQRVESSLRISHSLSSRGHAGVHCAVRTEQLHLLLSDEALALMDRVEGESALGATAYSTGCLLKLTVSLMATSFFLMWKPLPESSGRGFRI